MLQSYIHIIEVRIALKNIFDALVELSFSKTKEHRSFLKKTMV